MGEAGPVFTRPVRMLAFVSVALLVWMNVDHGPAFRAATGQSLPDLSVAGYDEAWLRALAARVAERPEAQTVLSRLHAGPDLVLPFALAALGIALILRLAPGNRIFGQVIGRRGMIALTLLPLGYLAADLGENIASMLLFAPATPAPALADRLFSLLPTLTASKFMLGFIAIMVVMRLAIGRRLTPAG